MNRQAADIIKGASTTTVQQAPTAKEEGRIVNWLVGYLKLNTTQSGAHVGYT